MNRYRRLAAIIVTAGVGLLLLQAGRAASFIVNSEAENGKLSGSAQTVREDGASAGAAIRFIAAAGQPPAGRRDPLKQPFASHSIWNMPIGGGGTPRQPLAPELTP